jgi:LCP family protein required for cell wall assembly
MVQVSPDTSLLPVQEDDPAQRVHQRRRTRRVLLVVLALLLVPVLLVAGGLAWWVRSVDSDVQRIPGAFAGLDPQTRPAKPAGTPGEGVTFLLGGTDRRSDVPTTGDDAAGIPWLPGAQRSDAIMLLHVTGDRSAAYVISIPRDAWVDIPGHGRNKINAAYSFGGPSLFVRTVEDLTGLRVDHLAVIDWAGFVALIDAMDGVTLTFDQPVEARGRTIPAGTHTLSGEEALAYVGERKALRGGDFDRIKRQQNVMRAVFQQMLSADTLAHPGTAAAVARAVAATVTVDDELGVTDMAGLGYGLRGLRGDDVHFVTAPTTGVGYEGKQSVVYLDQDALPGFFDAVREDDLAAWIAEHGADTLPDTGAVS